MHLTQKYASRAAEAKPQTLLLLLAEPDVLEILGRSSIVRPVPVAGTSEHRSQDGTAMFRHAQYAYLRYSMTVAMALGGADSNCL